LHFVKSESVEPNSQHPPPEAFERLARGTASPEESREMVRHLLRGCEACGQRSRAARNPRRADRALNYDDAFDRVERRLLEGLDKLESERETARRLYEELLEHEAVQGLMQIHSTRRYASLALCELLLRTARDAAIEDAERARRATELAVRVAEQLDLDLYGAPVVQDIRATAWAYLADTGRTHADLRLAESAMKIAETLVDEGTGDPLVKAELLALKASLLSYGGRFDEALHLLNKVAALYRRAGDRHLLGRTYIKKGTILGNAGEVPAALRLIRSGMDLIDPSREPRLMVCATHNYIWFLKENGRTGQAAACVEGARRLYQRAGDRRDLGRLRWVEGKIAEHPGDRETNLLAARDGLAREGLAYEAALAAMDLAVHYANGGRAAEMRRQADQMLPLFRCEEMYRETLLALLSYQQGGKRPEPAKLLDELGSHLERAWREKNPARLAPPV
jgi:hypothetical protein